MKRAICFIALGSILLTSFVHPVAEAQTNRTSTGVIVADRSVTLAAKIVGRIAAVNVEEGQSVAAGDILVDIDDAQLRADLSSYRAVLSQEKVRLDYMKKLDDRFSALYQQKSISLDKADEAKFNHEVAATNVQRAQADVSKIEVMLAETKIRAPFSGVIIGKTAEIGKVTVMGEALLELEDQSTLKFRTRVKERDIAHIEIGQEMTVTIDALDDLRLAGTVSTIIPSGDISTHEFTVEATLPPQDRLYPGMFGKAEF
jgi:membrane fusion protein (multidrug efflux system)